MTNCSICASKIKHSIDQLIVTGASNRAISRQFPDFSKDAVRRHRPHVSKKIQEANDEQEKQDGLQLDSLLKDTVDELRDLADNAKHAADYKAAAAALGHIIRVAEILAKVPPGGPENHKTEDSWTDIRVAILEAVDHDPEAKAAIISALEQRRRPAVRPGSSDLGEGGPGVQDGPMASKAPPEQV